MGNSEYIITVCTIFAMNRFEEKASLRNHKFYDLKELGIANR